MKVGLTIQTMFVIITLSVVKQVWTSIRPGWYIHPPVGCSGWCWPGMWRPSGCYFGCWPPHPRCPTKYNKTNMCCIYDLVKSGLDGIDIFRRNATIINRFFNCVCKKWKSYCFKVWYNYINWIWCNVFICIFNIRVHNYIILYSWKFSFDFGP